MSLNRRLFRLNRRRIQGSLPLTRAGRRSLRFREIGLKVVPSGNPERNLDSARAVWSMFQSEDPLR